MDSRPNKMDLNLPQEKLEVVAMFLGAVLIASILSSAAYWLIQKSLPPPPTGRLPLWLAVWLWACGLFIAIQFRNVVLRGAVLLWVLARVIFWVSYGHEGGDIRLAATGIYLTAGLLMVVIGSRRSKPKFCVAALFLLVGVSAIQYHAAITYAKAFGYISIMHK